MEEERAMGGELVAVYRFEYYIPRRVVWPAVERYPRLPLSYETFLLWWR